MPTLEDLRAKFLDFDFDNDEAKRRAIAVVNSWNQEIAIETLLEVEQAIVALTFADKDLAYNVVKELNFFADYCEQTEGMAYREFSSL